MKRIISIITLTLFFVLTALNLVGCGHKHAFAYDIESPTCTEDGYSYGICECGESKRETLTALGHAYGEFESNGDGTHSKVCSNDSKHVITEDCSGGTATETQRPICTVCNGEYGSVFVHNHDFSLQIETQEYFASNATCDSSKKYYYSCACGEKSSQTFSVGSALGHDYGAYVSSGNGRHSRTCKRNSSHVSTENCSGGKATCVEKAVCSKCHQQYGNLSEHVYGISGKCKECKIDKPVYIIDKNNNQRFYFGNYPQTKVTNSQLCDTLNSLVSNPKYDVTGWTDYNYYYSAAKTDLMYYVDVVYQDDMYRGVYIEGYRPAQARVYASQSTYFQAENGYYEGSVYWFKYEPISWVYTDSAGLNRLLVCEMALDAQIYDISSNDYASSEIREWLNKDFYNTAFNSAEKEIILAMYSGESDQVGLLSWNNVERYLPDYKTRTKKATDYTKCQGVYISNGYAPWLLNTKGDPGASMPKVCAVAGNGYLTETWDVYTVCGIVPVIKIEAIY